jgi:putative redox protein
VVSAAPTDQLAATIDAIRTDWSRLPEAPIATFVAETRLVDGFATAADVRQFGLAVDEPPTLGGTDRGPTPVELVLTALGTCQEIVYATYARVLGIPVDAVAVGVEGRLDPRGFFGVTDVPAGFQDISFAVDITSPAGPEAIGRLVATVNAHCPVLDILRQPVPVAGHYRLNGIPVAAADRPEPVLPAVVAD